MKKQKKHEYLVSVSKIGAIRERRIQTSGLYFYLKHVQSHKWDILSQMKYALTVFKMVKRIFCRKYSP